MPGLKPLSRRLPPLAMVRAFEAVGRLSSIRAAAVDLGVTHTAISRHIRNLEGWLGVQLVASGPRGSRLTPEGQSYFTAVSTALEMIAVATDEFRPASGEKVLHVWCAPGVAARWLTPRLPALQAALPDVDIVLKAADREADFSRHEADLQVRWEADTQPESRWKVQELCRPRMIPVASPQFLGRNAVQSLADLAHLPLIHEESRDQWRLWLKLAGFGGEMALNGPRLGQANLALDAAARHQGVALAPAPLVRDDLEAGRLIEMLQTDIRLGAYILVASPDRWNMPAIARFRHWVQAAFAEDQ